MKATVAYEAPRRQKANPAVKPLKWHIANPRATHTPNGGYEAQGQRAHYLIIKQKPNRRLGIFRWALLEDHGQSPDDVTWVPVPVRVAGGNPKSSDDLSELKDFASSYDAMPPTVEVDVAVVEVNAEESKLWPDKSSGDPARDFVRLQHMLAAYAQSNDLGRYVRGSADLKGSVWVFYTESRSGGRQHKHKVTEAELLAAPSSRDFLSAAKESPTREEWEVVVSNPPNANRGAILNMVGPGDGFEAGNKIILQGFHDDTQAANVGAAIAKRYKCQVTFGPKRAMEAAETPAAREQHVCSAGCRHAHEGASEAPRRRTDEERRFPLRWTDTPKGNSFAHGVDGIYYVNGPTGRPESWLLTGPRGVPLGAFASKQAAEDEAEREEFLERRNTRMRRSYRDEDDGPLA